MAVYTEVSLSEAQELFQPLGKIIEFEGIKEGVENTNYLVKLSDNKKFILDNFLYGDVHWNKNGTQIIFENVIKNIEF